MVPHIGKCLCSTSPIQYVKVQIIEQVYSEHPSKIEEVLRYRERYWQSQLFTVTHEMNSIMTFTAKNVRDIESKSFFQPLYCCLITFGHSLLFLIVYSPIIFS